QPEREHGQRKKTASVRRHAGRPRAPVRMLDRAAVRDPDGPETDPCQGQKGPPAADGEIHQVIKAVIFDFDNTLMDFMRMKRAAVETAVDAMIDAGLPYKKEDMIAKIYKGYSVEGIEDQQIFDKVLFQEFGKIDYKILGAGI